ncbi:coenzyme F430 synthase [uncultured Methanobrevibacter sp.]|uniref:coenzyme F430 synthase n=1 Tax=uncultured Methanobrevibacter sp. TaxID=253161 RepID=UPI0025E5A80F|nr:coenzyme F430 synthase [uncultured Methanobrevibacter sp.]
MHYIVIDLTHGGVKIAISLAKKGKVVHAIDYYDTLNVIDTKMLEVYDINLISLENLSNFKGKACVIAPIHFPLTSDEIQEYNPDLNCEFLTHHEAVAKILKNWGEDIPKIEVTGVKGKTSSVFMLKEILIDENPLILSSLGAILYDNKRELVLKKDISITPANIKETIDLAYKVANPVCLIAEGKLKSENLKKYSSAIFESSLGVTGIGDVGLLTNIAEDYPIAKAKSSASSAKAQVFRCKTVACQKEAYDKYYSQISHERLNTFSLNDSKANLYAKRIIYSLDKTSIDISYSDVKTNEGNVLSGDIQLKCFAPGPHHVSNVLGVVLASLCLEIPHEKIINGLENYRGIAGRTNMKLIENSIIIEEINPGINTQAIKESINMITNPKDFYIAIGGDYGITCEEIDEEKLSQFLGTAECNIILTGDVGKSLSKRLSENIQFIENYNDCYDLAIKNNKNLLFIYRSDYRKLSQR